MTSSCDSVFTVIQHKLPVWLLCFLGSRRPNHASAIHCPCLLLNCFPHNILAIGTNPNTYNNQVSNAITRHDA